MNRSRRLSAGHAVLALSAVAGTAGVLGLALEQWAWGSAASVLSVLAALVWLVLRVRTVLARLEGVERAQRTAARQLGRTAEKASEAADGHRVRVALRDETRALRRELERVRAEQASAMAHAAHDDLKRAEGLARNVYAVLVAVQRTPSVTAELQRVYDRVVDHDRPMPELGDWAMTASTLTWMLDQVAHGSVSTILECGSGSSTVWFAAALERRGGAGHVTALESDAEYAEQTRRRLDELGLGHRARVVHAPLVPLSLPGRADQPWFDLSGLGDVSDVDLLFVDGPVGGLATESRFPAFPMLAERLASDALVVLDDVDRRDEQAIAAAWVDGPQAGVSLTRIHRTDRAMAFRARR